MDEVLQENVQRAKELLKTVRHAAMATVNADGLPHNTPVQFQIDGNLQHFYWASNPAALHSRNIERTGQFFAVLYELGSGDGLYLRAQNGHELSGAELEIGLQERNRQRAEQGRPTLGIEHYSGATSQRMYGAEVVQFWVNESEKDAEGNITNDYRTEVTREDLL